MPSDILLTLLGGSLVGALLTFLVAMRKMSGKVATSEASLLWAESQAMREDYRHRLLAEEERTKLLEDRVSKLEDLNQLLMLDNRDLRREVADLQTQLARAKG